jgi:hypothetical protein
VGKCAALRAGPRERKPASPKFAGAGSGCFFGEERSGLVACPVSLVRKPHVCRRGGRDSKGCGCGCGCRVWCLWCAWGWFFVVVRWRRRAACVPGGSLHGCCRSSVASESTDDRPAWVVALFWLGTYRGARSRKRAPVASSPSKMGDTACSARQNWKRVWSGNSLGSVGGRARGDGMGWGLVAAAGSDGQAAPGSVPRRPSTHAAAIHDRSKYCGGRGVKKPAIRPSSFFHCRVPRTAYGSVQKPTTSPAPKQASADRVRTPTNATQYTWYRWK